MLTVDWDLVFGLAGDMVSALLPLQLAPYALLLALALGGAWLAMLRRAVRRNAD